MLFINMNLEKEMNELDQINSKPLEKVRSQVILSLQHAYAHNLLTENEFEKRLGEATNLDDKQALSLLVTDVPIVNENYENSQSQLNRESVRETYTVFTVMSGTEKKGIWSPPRKMKVLNIMGGTELDYTKALMPPGITDVNITCVMGGVEIRVPEGINVEVHGIPVMGGIDNKSDSVYREYAPTLRIKALVVMGGLDIKTVRS